MSAMPRRMSRIINALLDKLKKRGKLVIEIAGSNPVSLEIFIRFYS